MPSADILCSWLVRSALVSLTILLIGSGAVLIWRQPLRRVRIIELVLAGCLIAPWLGMIPGYPQLSVVKSQATAIKHQEAPLPPSEPMIEPTMTEPTMPFPTLDRAATPVSSSTKTAEAPVHDFEIRPWIVGIYLAGVVIGACWWLVGIAGLARLLWTSQPAPSRCRDLLAEISGGRGDRVRLFVNHRLSQPFASAWGRAVIVLPENLCGDEQTLRWCLAHEWAHVDGHDFRSWLLAGLARVLFFYQPLLWWLRRQLRLCQDFVADSQAARHAPEVEDYAEFLTARAAAGGLHPALGLSMGCRKSELYRRVIMLLNNESFESRTPRLWTVSVTVIALVLVGVVAAVSLVPRAVAEEKQATSQSTKAGDKTIGLPKELTVDLGGGVKLEIVLIPAGEFLMGSPDSDKDSFPFEFVWKPQHRVRITKPFYMGKYLVTQEQWEAVMGNNPSYFKGPKNPVEMVSWEDCQKFLKRLNDKVGGGKFQLPTEAQWEYACRAGSKTKYCFGDDERQLGDYAWHDKIWGGKTHPVGEKKPNAWGLYDMHGNTFEWCQDWWNAGYYRESPVDDPPGAATGSSRVNRGGSWYTPAWSCRSAFRYRDSPGGRLPVLGLRVSRVPADKSTTGSPPANEHFDTTSAAKPPGELSFDTDPEHFKAVLQIQPGEVAFVTEPEHFKAVFQIQPPGLVLNDVDDAELDLLKTHPNLQSLRMRATKVTDSELARLKVLTRLELLDLGYCKNVTDAGLGHLKGLTTLQSLNLDGTRITDAGLASLKGLPQLRILDLRGTKVTNGGVKKLQQALPKCKIAEPAAASPAPATPKANDQSNKTSAAKPADEVSPTSDQSPTKEGAKTESNPVPTHELTAETNTDQAKAIAEIKKLGGKVTVDEKSPVISVELEGTRVSDANLASLKGLTQLQSLELKNTDVTDAGLAIVKGLTHLQSLDLTTSKVTDAGLANLCELTTLQTLNLYLNFRRFQAGQVARYR